jgi:hypothetical protein
MTTVVRNAFKDGFGDSFKTLTKMFLKDVKRSGGDNPQRNYG